MQAMPGSRMRRLLAILFPALLLAPAAALAQPAPPLSFEAGAVLAGGHVLRAATVLPARAGPAELPLLDGRLLHWHVVIENGETRLLDEKNRLAAKAEYHRQQRNGQPACQIYQTTISPEWAVRKGEPDRGAQGGQQADFTPADDRVYSFRDAPCP